MVFQTGSMKWEPDIMKELAQRVQGGKKRRRAGILASQFLASPTRALQMRRFSSS
jgi:hypothetical protein